MHGGRLRLFLGHERKMRKQISKKLRHQVLERDNFMCCNCGATNCLQIDHIVPVCEGGPSILSNLQTLCQDCNLGKGVKIPQSHPEKGIPIRDLEKEWNLSRNGLKGRAKFLGVKFIRVSSTNSLWPYEKVPLGQKLHEHLKSGKDMNSFCDPSFVFPVKSKRPETRENKDNVSHWMDQDQNIQLRLIQHMKGIKTRQEHLSKIFDDYIASNLHLLPLDMQ
jgi:hypothetical protein